MQDNPLSIAAIFGACGLQSAAFDCVTRAYFEHSITRSLAGIAFFSLYHLYIVTLANRPRTRPLKLVESSQTKSWVVKLDVVV